jgi:hypothetical protein
MNNNELEKKELSFGKKILYGFLLGVSLIIGAGVWTFKLSLILSIIISIVAITSINYFWDELKK